MRLSRNLKKGILLPQRNAPPQIDMKRLSVQVGVSEPIGTRVVDATKPTVPM